MDSKSQDTLYLSNGEKIPSQIIEVTPTEVKYKKSNNPEGPTYTSENSTVKFIKYRNGSVDTIKVTIKTPQEIAISDQLKTSTPAEKSKKPAIYFSSSYYRYNGNEMREADIHKLIQKTHNVEINEYVKKSKNAKIAEYVGFLAVPALIYGIISARDTYNHNEKLYSTFYGANNSSLQKSYGPAIAAGVVGVLSLTTTIISKPIRRKNTEAAIRVYNEKY